jgi:hypothetical protein
MWEGMLIELEPLGSLVYLSLVFVGIENQWEELAIGVGVDQGRTKTTFDSALTVEIISSVLIVVQ